MDRRTGLVAAGGVAATVAAAALAVGINAGLLGADPTSDKVGKLDAEGITELTQPASVSTTLPPEVVIIDEPAPASGGGPGHVVGPGLSGSETSAPPASAVAPLAPVTASTDQDAGDDHGRDGDDPESDDRDDDRVDDSGSGSSSSGHGSGGDDDSFEHGSGRSDDDSSGRDDD